MSDAHFHPTQWTLVLRSLGECGEARAALSDLCAAYYAPVVVFLRRDGRDEDAAREMAHAFFAGLLQRGVGAPDRARGKFRSYLLAALRHFLQRQRTAAAALKRGGGTVHLPLADETDTSPGFLPQAADTPDHLFDRDWALALIGRALERLEAEHQEKAGTFEVLKPWLHGAPEISQSAAAAALGMSETALKVAIHRLRARFREHIRAEVAATVPDPSDISGELRYLVDILSSPAAG